MTGIENSKDRISRFTTLIMIVDGSVSDLMMLSGRNSVLDSREMMYLLITTAVAQGQQQAMQGFPFSCERFVSLQGREKKQYLESNSDGLNSANLQYNYRVLMCIMLVQMVLV